MCDEIQVVTHVCKWQGMKQDCYHYALPGVPDWWTKVLYNVWRAKFGLDQ
jgi:hypothetical protein